MKKEQKWKLEAKNKNLSACTDYEQLIMIFKILTEILIKFIKSKYN